MVLDVRVRVHQHRVEQEHHLFGLQIALFFEIVELVDQLPVGVHQLFVLLREHIQRLFEILARLFHAVVLELQVLELVGALALPVLRLVELPFDVREPVELALHEIGILELVVSLLVFLLVEAVHVQLPHEGRVILGFEKRRQDLGEILNVLDDDRGPVLVPPNRALASRILFRLTPIMLKVVIRKFEIVLFFLPFLFFCIILVFFCSRFFGYFADF